MNDIFAALQTPVTPAGMPSSLSQQFMASNYTYPGRSLSAIGTGQQYHFVRVNTYQTPDYSSWYSNSTTGGSTGTIIVNFTTTMINGSSTWSDTGGLYAVLNGTPGMVNTAVGSGTSPFPGNTPWIAEATKTWQGATKSGSFSNGQVMTITISGLAPGTYTLQFWDVGSGQPPSSCTYLWQLPPASPSFTVMAGQTITINGQLDYNNVNAPAGSFYNWYVTW
jgi:hypothetical protein